MRMIIVSGVAAVALPFIIGMYATNARVGLDVSERFLERLSEIPSGATQQERELNAANLKSWVLKHPEHAARYARGIMPMDLLYLLALGCFLGLGSAWLAQDLSWPRCLAAVPAWTWWVLPGLYIAADLLEDATIALLMTYPDLIETTSVRILMALKTVKILAVGLAMTVAALLGVAGLSWGKSI